MTVTPRHAPPHAPRPAECDRRGTDESSCRGVAPLLCVTMSALVGPFLVVCVILAVGGAAKIATPLQARRAIRAVGLELPLWSVRLLGAAEIALAGAAALKGGVVLPIAVGMAYLAFAAFVVLMLRSGVGTSCGCFGSASTPPSNLHIAVNVAAAAAAVGAAGVDGLVTTLGDQAGAGLPLVALVLVGSYATYLILTALPTVLAPPEQRVASFALADPGHREAPQR